MARKRGLGFVALIVIILVLPTALSLGWYYLSKNPSLRPLGVTEQALAAYSGESAGVEIVALVDWVPGSGKYTKAQLARAISQSFAAKGVAARIMFRDGQRATQVTYKIGKTILGPYSTDRASEGIRAAVEAFNMF